MLQEILLALSGHRSEIWEKVKDGSSNGDLHKYVSEPERAMLGVLAHLSDLHIQLKQDAARISSDHKSIICRVIGSSISNKHLTDFQKKILDVESSILQRDAGYVGGYGIVPLSTVVGEFAPWTRRMEWLRSVTERADKLENIPTELYCTGKDMLDFLQAETCTGYSDLEVMATQLLIAGQKAWMQSLASWVLYGKLSAYGAGDFLVQKDGDMCRLENQLLPRFVNQRTAVSILSIGNALNQIRLQNRVAQASVVKVVDPAMDLMSVHLRLLESISFPINGSILEKVMTAIDQSISRNSLSQLLPLQQILEILEVIQRYVLLGSGEFALSLITNADERVAHRQQMHTSKPIRKLGRLDDFAITNTEFNAIMAKTWAELASLQLDEGLDDAIFVLARQILSLRRGPAGGEKSMAISTLLPTATVLDFRLPTHSALTLFLAPTDMKMYSSINAFLISLRRSEVHVSDLWKLTGQRRCFPTPLGPPHSATSVGQRALSARRLREFERNKRIRRHWAASSKARFVINELGGYYHGEVIQNSWSRFVDWLYSSRGGRPLSATSQISRPGSSSSTKAKGKTDSEPHYDSQNKNSDPRTLAQGHHAFLTALYEALLLDNQDFLKALKDLLTMMDHYVALFARLQTIWQGLDLQEDDGVVDAFSNYVNDEKDVLEEMDRSRNAVEQCLTSLVETIRRAERQRAIDSVTDGMIQLELDPHTFVPWRARTMDRLIMRLNFLAGRDDQDEAEDGIAGGFDDD